LKILIVRDFLSRCLKRSSQEEEQFLGRLLKREAQGRKSTFRQVFQKMGAQEEKQFLGRLSEKISTCEEQQS
jgi:hypothetical protein